MRAVIGTVISSEPVTLKGAAGTLSNFAAAATGSRPELAVFSTRASRAFAELLAFHRGLRSPHPAATGDLHSTRNRADPAQIGAGIGIGDESPSLGVNRAAGLENGAGSGVEREIDVKRKKMRERSEAEVENIDIHAEEVKKRRRTTKKPYSRSIVGATLEVIQKKRTEKPEVRVVDREAALRISMLKK